LENACASTRGIERDEGAVAGPQEAVTHEIYVIVVSVASRDRPRLADAGREGAADRRERR
jgi:hypothetical protein